MQKHIKVQLGEKKMRGEKKKKERSYRETIGGFPSPAKERKRQTGGKSENCSGKAWAKETPVERNPARLPTERKNGNWAHERYKTATTRRQGNK